MPTLTFNRDSANDIIDSSPDNIADAITAAQGKVANAYTAVSNKGGTLPATQNLTNLATAISSIPSGTTPTGTLSITANGIYDVTNYANANVNVSGGSGTTDVPLTRISDDNGNEIGTWYMNFEDANGNVFKVIVLDAQYRSNSTQWCSNTSTVTNMPIYSSSLNAWWYDNAKETATQNTQLILDYCTANSYTSTACSHCRSKSFTINGTIYYGQLPNMRELFDMWRHRVQIEQMDTSASSHSSTNFSSACTIWSSSQSNNYYGWYVTNTGTVSYNLKTYNYYACPVIEIPNI